MEPISEVVEIGDAEVREGVPFYRVLNLQAKLPQRLRAKAPRRLREMVESEIQAACEENAIVMWQSPQALGQESTASTMLRDWEVFVTLS